MRHKEIVKYGQYIEKEAVTRIYPSGSILNVMDKYFKSANPKN